MGRGGAAGTAEYRRGDGEGEGQRATGAGMDGGPCLAGGYAIYLSGP